LQKFNREEFIFYFYYIYLVTPKSKSKYIFFQIILAGIIMKTNEFIRRATKADYDEIVSIISIQKIPQTTNQDSKLHGFR
jgi:hypothetical protein